MKKLFYVSAALGNFDQASKLIKFFEKKGWTCTFNWTGTSFNPGPDAGLAKKELDGAAKADVLICRLPAGRGSHVEIGASLAAGKKVVLVYPEDVDLLTAREDGGYYSLLYYHPNICRFKESTVEDLFQFVEHLYQGT